MEAAISLLVTEKTITDIHEGSYIVRTPQGGRICHTAPVRKVVGSLEEIRRQLHELVDNVIDTQEGING